MKLIKLKMNTQNPYYTHDLTQHTNYTQSPTQNK